MQQPQPCAAPLTVTLHDDQDQAVSGAAVALRGTTQTATTDQAGEAQLCASQAGAVRVAVSGQLASGTPLRLLGQDAEGIRFTLSSGEENRLDLRAEPSGEVLPDPSTMWAREVNGPPVSTVVVPTSAAQLQPTQPALILTAPEAAAPIATVQATVAVPSQPVATPNPPAHSPLLVAAVLVVVLLIVTLVLLRVKPVRPQRAEF
jgi:hypothetical protein